TAVPLLASGAQCPLLDIKPNLRPALSARRNPLLGDRVQLVEVASAHLQYHDISFGRLQRLLCPRLKSRSINGWRLGVNPERKRIERGQERQGQDGRSDD